MISPTVQSVMPMRSVRRRPRKSPTKMVRMAETRHPRCHAPTVRPNQSVPTPTTHEVAQHTSDPGVVERSLRRAQDINLGKALQESTRSQETSQHTLCISKTSVHRNQHTLDSPRSKTYKKHNPHTALTRPVKRAPRRPKKRAIASELTRYNKDKTAGARARAGKVCLLPAVKRQTLSEHAFSAASRWRRCNSIAPRGDEVCVMPALARSAVGTLSLTGGQTQLWAHSQSAQMPIDFDCKVLHRKISR
jgi:hypothetical protein